MKVVDNTSLHEVLKDFFGFDTFKGNQEAIIKNILNGKDTFVIMPTGGGKSLTYQLPALISEGTAIIISPLISLMKNQVDNIRNFGVDEGIANFLNSSLSKQEMIEVKNDLLAGKTKLLYVAPETLTKKDNIEFFKQFKISFYAIDEAHCISEWGHDFRPEYRNIRPTVKEIGQKVPVIALTATATPKVQHDIQKNLGMMDAVVYKASFNRPNLYYEVRHKTKDVSKDIIKYIKTHTGKSGIIYCLSRKKVEELAETLLVNGIKALPYHAGLESEIRKENQDKFLMEEVDVIVATIAFGMGIDKPDVRYVIHHDMPKSLEGYYQETGRSGRDDGEGNCIAFYSIDDIIKLEKFTAKKAVNEQEIAKQLLAETITYAESSVCRRKLLLHYFGEVYDEENCQCCDNCLHPKTKFDGTEYVEIVLEAVEESKEQYKANHLIQLIVGKPSATFKNSKLKVFGKGCEKDEKFWNGVVRQTVINRFLAKDIENFGILRFTDEGRKFLEEPFKVMLTQDHDYDSTEDDEFYASGGKTSTADKTLFSLLKDLRKQISRKENLPPFIIFQDPSLEDMAIQYPIKIDELMQITGVGAGKAQKYGKPFLDLIAKYVEENEIIRPMDMVVKSVVNKSGIKVYIIQSIDRKVPLEDIAQAKNLSISDLLNELESIVTSGTKLDISYYIDEYVDPYHHDEIFDYFNNAETDSIDDALTELGEQEFNEEEVRLVRLKYLSEIGN